MGSKLFVIQNAKRKEERKYRPYAEGLQTLRSFQGSTKLFDSQSSYKKMVVLFESEFLDCWNMQFTEINTASSYNASAMDATKQTKRHTSTIFFYIKYCVM